MVISGHCVFSIFLKVCCPSSDLYTATGELTLDSTAEKIWTISSEFKYPDENAVTINEHYQLYVASK